MGYAKEDLVQRCNAVKVWKMGFRVLGLGRQRLHVAGATADLVVLFVNLLLLAKVRIALVIAAAASNVRSRQFILGLAAVPGPAALVRPLAISMCEAAAPALSVCAQRG